MTEISNNNMDRTQPSPKSKLVFMGTGSSEGTPLVTCLVAKHFYCKVCHDAIKNPNSKNRRRNTSMLIKYYDKKSNTYKNILIDCGKTYKQGAIQLFPKHNVNRIDAVLLTHDHVDAVAGLDDLRDFTQYLQDSIPIYLRKRDYLILKQTQYYLVDTRLSTGSHDVARLQFIPVDEECQSLDICGLQFTPLPVYHGRNYMCWGFKFGKVVYLSDCSKIPRDVMKKIYGCDLLVLDSVDASGTHPSHFCLPQSIEHVKKIKPKKCYLIGMSHDFDHEEINKELAKLKVNGIDVELSYDGLCLEVDL